MTQASELEVSRDMHEKENVEVKFPSLSVKKYFYTSKRITFKDP